MSDSESDDNDEVESIDSEQALVQVIDGMFRSRVARHLRRAEVEKEPYNDAVEPNKELYQAAYLLLVTGMVVLFGTGLAFVISGSPVSGCSVVNISSGCMVVGQEVLVLLKNGATLRTWPVVVENNSLSAISLRTTSVFEVGSVYTCWTCLGNSTTDVTSLLSFQDMMHQPFLEERDRLGLSGLRHFVEEFQAVLSNGIIMCSFSAFSFLFLNLLWKFGGAGVGVMKLFDQGVSFWARPSRQWYGDKWHLVAKRIFGFGVLANALDAYLSATLGLFIVVQFDSFSAGPEILIPLIIFVVLSGATVEYRAVTFFVVEDDGNAAVVVGPDERSGDSLVQIVERKKVSIYIHEAWFWLVWTIASVLETGQLSTSILGLVCESGAILPVCRVTSGSSALTTTILVFSVVESVLRLWLLVYGMLFRLYPGNVFALWKILTNNFHSQLTAASKISLCGYRSSLDSVPFAPRWQTGLDEIELEPVTHARRLIC